MSEHSLPCARCGDPVELDGPPLPGWVAMHPVCNRIAHTLAAGRLDRDGVLGCLSRDGGPRLQREGGAEA